MISPEEHGRKAVPEQAKTPDIAAILDQMWVRFLPEIRQRTDVLESGAAAMAAGELMDAQLEAAHAAAHKLAGTLGTFDLMRGTELAREFELLTARDAAPNPALGTRLVSIAAELRDMIEHRK